MYSLSSTLKCEFARIIRVLCAVNAFLQPLRVAQKGVENARPPRYESRKTCVRVVNTNQRRTRAMYTRTTVNTQSHFHFNYYCHASASIKRSSLIVFEYYMKSLRVGHYCIDMEYIIIERTCVYIGAPIQPLRRYLHAIYFGAYRFPRTINTEWRIMVEWWCCSVCVCVHHHKVELRTDRARKCQPSQGHTHTHTHTTMCKLTFGPERNQIRHIAHIACAEFAAGEEETIKLTWQTLLNQIVCVCVIRSVTCKHFCVIPLFHAPASRACLRVCLWVSVCATPAPARDRQTTAHIRTRDRANSRC